MRIAIVKLSALGDIVHAMVVLQFIKKFSQEISIDWFVEEQALHEQCLPLLKVLLLLFS